MGAYYTPESVASVAAQWATAGDRESILDIGCGAGDLFSAAVDSIANPTNAWAIDTNGIACALTAARTTPHGVPPDHVRRQDVFELVDQSESELRLNSTLTETLPEQDPERFDCIFAHPPVGRTHQLTEAAPNSLPHSRIEENFIAAGCQLLAPGGRGCFIIPARSIRRIREQVIPDDVQITRIVSVPDTEFTTMGTEPTILCVERAPAAESIGVVKISSFDDPDRALGALFNPESAESVESVAAALVAANVETTVLQTLSRSPGAAPFFGGQFPTLEAVTEHIAIGMTTGDNRTFYFDPDERAASAISDQFFTPVIKTLPEERTIIKRDQVSHYLFDLREFIESHDLDPSDRAAVADALASVDSAAAEYVQTEFRDDRQSTRGVLPRSCSLENPDLVAHEVSRDLTWYRIDPELRPVLFSNNLRGIACSDEIPPERLQTILNSPLYQLLNESRFPRMARDTEAIRIQMEPLRKLPICLLDLSDREAAQLERLHPYNSPEHKESARSVIIDAVAGEHQPAVAATYDAVSPLRTVRGYEAEIEQLHQILTNGLDTEPEAIDLVDDSMIQKLEETYQTVGLFETRTRPITELMDVFGDQRYWSFLGGVAAQFEGVLQDYIEEHVGPVEFRQPPDDDSKRWMYRPTGGDWKPLRLKILFDEVFSGDLQNVMQLVRERRNEIAHGRLLSDEEANAEALLLAFYIFTYAVLHKENARIASAKSER
nr:class I SAM-dependent methyltransferase [Halorubellus sp. JP-L1]